MSFYHITSRLCIDIFCAYNLRAVNLHGKDSDPFAKVKVKLTKDSMPMMNDVSHLLNRYSGNMKERCSDGSLRPLWLGRRCLLFGTRSNADFFDAVSLRIPSFVSVSFTVADVSADDLPKMYVEIIVLDKERFRAAQPLGKVEIHCVSSV